MPKLHNALCLRSPAQEAWTPGGAKHSAPPGGGTGRTANASFVGCGAWVQRAFDWKATNIVDLNRAQNERVLRLLGVADLNAGLRLLVYDFAPLGSLDGLLQEEARLFCTVPTASEPSHTMPRLDFSSSHLIFFSFPVP